MPASSPASARRNTVILTVSAATAGLLMLYPTSTNGGGDQRRPGQPLAPAGVVRPAPVSPAVPTAVPTVVVNGTSIDTPYGRVQVQVVSRAGHLVGATAIDYPQGGGRDRQINGYAIPVLQQEALAAQSAQVDTVSGATYTSNGYRKSLQAALDTAHQA